VAQKFGFGGKELSEELGLQWHDFSARNYDASLGRWFVIDPLADAKGQVHNTPYGYAMNNPIFYIDPDGNCPPGVDCYAVAKGAWNFLKGVGRGVGSFINSAVDNNSFEGKAKNRLTRTNQPKSKKPLSVQIAAAVTNPIIETAQKGVEAVASGDAGKMGEFIGENSPALLLTKKLPR